MSMCDTCMSPGACCKKLFLTGGEFNLPQSPEAAEHSLMRRGLPFRINAESEHHPGRYTYWCTALQRDGRCGIYEDRPELCRSYLPGSDPLCVHHWSPDVEESGEPSPTENTEGAAQGSRREMV